MAGLIRAVALDLDGTRVDGDRLSAAAIEQVDRLRDGGLVAMLVTGRIAPELDAAFPGLRGHFDAVVTENGAVLSLDGDVRDLVEAVDGGLEAALAELGIEVRRGRV